MKTPVNHEYTTEQSTSLRAHAREQVKTHTQACLDFARALYEVRYGKIKGTDEYVWKTWGFPDFETYCERELLWHGGTCTSYIRVYDELCVRRSFEDGELPPSITALRELAKISKHHAKDARELGKWVKISHEHTACEFKDLVEKQLYGGTARKFRFGFVMTSAARERIMRRLRAAREQMQTEAGEGKEITLGQALEAMIVRTETGRPTAREAREARRYRKAS
jgi:hypothetical protein